MSYAERHPLILADLDIMGAAVELAEWRWPTWSRTALARPFGVNETGLGGTTASPSSRAVALQGRGHPPCLARGAVEPGLAREGAGR